MSCLLYSLNWRAGLGFELTALGHLHKDLNRQVTTSHFLIKENYISFLFVALSVMWWICWIRMTAPKPISMAVLQQLWSSLSLQKLSTVPTLWWVRKSLFPLTVYLLYAVMLLSYPNQTILTITHHSRANNSATISTTVLMAPSSMKAEALGPNLNRVYRRGGERELCLREDEVSAKSHCCHHQEVVWALWAIKETINPSEHRPTRRWRTFNLKKVPQTFTTK